MHLPELRTQTRVSGLRLKLTNDMRVVTQDWSKVRTEIYFWSRTSSCSIVKPVVTRGSTVHCTQIGWKVPKG
jgi:hypothetical protein